MECIMKTLVYQHKLEKVAVTSEAKQQQVAEHPEEVLVKYL